MRFIRRPAVLVPAVIVLVGVLLTGLYLFQPWKLFVDTTVDEASPLAASPSSKALPASSTPAAPTPGPPREPALLTTGTFISHEHCTTGTAKVIRKADGARVLRLEGLDTSNGPDLHVWLTDAPVIEGDEGWRVFDDGDYVDLGVLKGNKGSQNYPIPDDVDLADLTSVSIWCERFSDSFGAAELTSV